MPEDIARLRAVVRGRVQGVGFREYVSRRARVAGLSGYACNLPDGRSVEVMAEGPRGALEEFLRHLQEGPRMSSVSVRRARSSPSASTRWPATLVTPPALWVHSKYDGASHTVTSQVPSGSFGCLSRTRLPSVTGGGVRSSTVSTVSMRCGQASMSLSASQTRC